MYYLRNFLDDRFEKIYSVIENEYAQMNEYVNLIGSANYAFPSVLEAMNTPFNLNPSEGSRNNRYFPLCDNIDTLENMAEEWLQKLFLKEAMQMLLQKLQLTMVMTWTSEMQ